MNLHLVPDSSISRTFYNNVEKLGLLENNRFIVRTNSKKLTHIKAPLPFGRPYTKAFDELVGDTKSYQKVFLHQMPPLLYRWVARHSFNELSWLIWGTDVYNLPGKDRAFYEDLTWKKFMRKDFSKESTLFKLKVLLTNSVYKKSACKKVDHVLTWMNTEYDYARQHMLGLRADHRHFFYENDLPYTQLDQLVEKQSAEKRKKPALIVGNSGTPTNNHLDAIHYLVENKIGADLFIPVSYGNMNYVSFLKKQAEVYQGGTITFMDSFMPFEEYVQFLMSVDGLVMNTLRPQGYGNIFMMMYLGKNVYINDRNISLPDIQALPFKKLSALKTDFPGTAPQGDRTAVAEMFSSQKLKTIYTELFS